MNTLHLPLGPSCTRTTPMLLQLDILNMSAQPCWTRLTFLSPSCPPRPTEAFHLHWCDVQISDGPLSYVTKKTLASSPSAKDTSCSSVHVFTNGQQNELVNSQSRTRCNVTFDSTRTRMTSPYNHLVETEKVEELTPSRAAASSNGALPTPSCSLLPSDVAQKT